MSSRIYVAEADIFRCTDSAVCVMAVLGAKEREVTWDDHALLASHTTSQWFGGHSDFSWLQNPARKSKSSTVWSHNIIVTS